MKKSTKYESAVNLPIYIAKVNGIARYSPYLCKFVSHNKKFFMRHVQGFIHGVKHKLVLNLRNLFSF